MFRRKIIPLSSAQHSIDEEEIKLGIARMYINNSINNLKYIKMIAIRAQFFFQIIKRIT